MIDQSPSRLSTPLGRLKSGASSFAAALILTATVASAHANEAQSFAQTYAAAVAAEKVSASLDHRWTTTEAALKLALKQKKAHQDRRALATAKRALALANASVKQGKEQKTLWRDAVVK